LERAQDWSRIKRCQYASAVSMPVLMRPSIGARCASGARSTAAELLYVKNIKIRKKSALVWTKMN